MIPHDTPPIIHDLEQIAPLSAECVQMENGIKLYILRDSSQEVFKLDTVFKAGPYYQSQPILASTALNMMPDGTARHTAAEIADFFDFRGAYPGYNCSMRTTTLSLISLKRHAAEVIPMLAEMISESIYPEKERIVYLTNRAQEHRAQLRKTSFLARAEMLRRFFGPAHPYANVYTIDDFNRITTEALQQYRAERYTADRCFIVVSGGIDDALIQSIGSAFSALPSASKQEEEKRYPFSPSPAGRYEIALKGATQSGLRLAFKGVEIDSPDYPTALLLNTVLGGYFGSRLMSNIRERHGYTYGINSFIVPYLGCPLWEISAEVKAGKVNATLREIKREIRALKENRIGEEELKIVKRFIQGETLRSYDGAITQSDVLIANLTNRLPMDFNLKCLEQMNTLTPASLQEAANRLITYDDAIISICHP